MQPQYDMFEDNDIETGKAPPLVSGDERAVHQYIKEVYLHLSGLMGLAFIGCYSQLNSGLLLFIPAFIASLACLVYVYCGTNQPARVTAFMAFGFFDGWMLGPLLQHLKPPPQVLLTAVGLSAGIFVAFTLAALYAKRRTYLYLGGVLGSCIWGLLVVGVLNMFFGLAIFHAVTVYGGLVVFSLYVAYDTQVMIERAHHDDKDHLKDAINLFIDFMAILRRILIILSERD
eukprot:Rhum_TRINITY_DN17142_c0_g1::Rhum_TRINITY_DN17142_c0_g1_i1::g.165369::m.165369